MLKFEYDYEDVESHSPTKLYDIMERGESKEMSHDYLEYFCFVSSKIFSVHDSDKCRKHNIVVSSDELSVQMFDDEDDL